MLVRSTPTRNGNSSGRKSSVSFVPTERKSSVAQCDITAILRHSDTKWAVGVPSDAPTQETLCSLWRSTRCWCSTWCSSSSCSWSGYRASCTTYRHHDDTPTRTALIPTLSTTWPQSAARRTAMHLLTTSSRGAARHHVRPHSVSYPVLRPRGELTYCIIKLLIYICTTFFIYT